MPLKHPNKKKLDKTTSRPPKKKDSASRQRSEEDLCAVSLDACCVGRCSQNQRLAAWKEIDPRRPSRKCSTHVLRFQMLLGAATAMVIYAAYRKLALQTGYEVAGI